MAEKTERYVSEDDWFWSDPEIDLSYSITHHVCDTYGEQTTQPDESGVVFVAQFCLCGKQVGAYRDSIL